jgi:hypothetical protein
VLIFSCRPGGEAAGFSALEELFAAAAVDMEGTEVARASSLGRGSWVVGLGSQWAGLELCWWERERSAGKGRPAQR